MISKSRARIVLMVIFTMSVIFTMRTARGAVEIQTKTISQTSDDGFVTETGNLFDVPLCTILDPNMDIRSFVVFRGIEINSWERLENATLILRSAGSLEADTSSVTVWGISRVGHYLPIDAADVLTVPLTSSSVVADTSFFYGSATLEIDVTPILRELMSHPDWTGDGANGAGAGEKIGFLILGAEGHEVRYFYDELAANGLEPRIRIYWGEEPEPPPDADKPEEFNDTQVYTWTIVENGTTPFEGDGDYNETVDIWRVDAFGAPEFQYLSYDDAFTAYYHNSSTGVDGFFEIDENWGHPIIGGMTSPILSMGPWTLIMGDPGELTIYISDDEFTTNTSYIPNDEYTALDSFGGNIGSLAVDRQIDNLVHLVYTSVTPAQNAVYNVVYTNFTLDMGTGIPTFAPTFTNITQIGATQYSPVIHVQENGSLHVVWYGHDGTNEDQIWYRRRHENGTWLPKVRVSDTDVPGLPHKHPDVVANSETGVALVSWDIALNDVYWDVVFPNNTDDVDRLANTGTVASMVMDRQRNEALMAYSSATGQPATIYFMNITIANASAWSAPKQVSPGGEKHFLPDIGIETANGTVQVIWQNDWNSVVAGNYWNIMNDPVVGKDTVANNHGRWNFIEEEFERSILNTTYFVAWGNGTVISGPLDDLDEVDEFLDEYFGVDPKEPDPPSQGWDTVGPFQRFRTRLYILMIGIVLVFGPLIYWAMSRPSGYEFVIGAFILLVGFALMYAAGQV